MLVSSNMIALESNRRDVISSDIFVETSMKHVGKVKLNCGYWIHGLYILVMSIVNKLPNWARYIIGKNIFLSMH